MSAIEGPTRSTSLSALDGFKLAKYRFELKAKEPMMLPEFKGSTIRGGFGRLFKRICCASGESDCAACVLKNDCPYACVFETMPMEGADRMAGHLKVPRPYVFEPPLDGRTRYSQGDKLAFDLILIGRAIDFLPYFIVAMRELGEEGITVRRHKFELTSIYAVECLSSGKKLAGEKLVYSVDDNMVRVARSELTGADLVKRAEEFEGKRLKVDFLTPTRIKYRGAYCFADLPLVALIQNLTLRVNALSYFHCGGRWDDELKNLREIAQEARIARRAIAKKELHRYSSRQGKKDSLSGIVGSIVYEGNLSSLIPLLLLGQFIHAGSDAVFGCGKYEISDAD